MAMAETGFGHVGLPTLLPRHKNPISASLSTLPSLTASTPTKSKCLRCRYEKRHQLDARRKSGVFQTVRCQDEAVGNPVPEPKYNTYIDPNTGEPAPARGVRTNMPDREFWQEDMSRQSLLSSYAIEDFSGVNKGPGSGRQNAPLLGVKKGAGNAKRKSTEYTPEKRVSVNNLEPSTESKARLEEIPNQGLSDKDADEDADEIDDEDEFRDEYVTYHIEEDDKHGSEDVATSSKVKLNPKKPLPNDELWPNWRKPPKGKEVWSAWNIRPGDSDIAMAAAMAEKGEIKLFGEKPSVAEAFLARVRRRAFYEERIRDEEERKKEIGPMAYYQEWVKSWKRDTSKEAVAKHFKETGEDLTTQMLDMFSCQTAEEYRRMMGTDIRIKRDPLTMRMREDQIKQVWGGDPVYPTINYVQDPDHIIDFRAPNLHEPIPSTTEMLRRLGRLITQEELKKWKEEVETLDEEEENVVADPMASAVDIGDKEDEEGEDSEPPLHPWRLGGGKKRS